MTDAATPSRDDRDSFYRSIVEDQTDLISLSHPDGQIIYVNAAYARYFGLAAEAMVGTNVLDYVAAPDRAGVAAYLQELCRQPGVGQGENQMQYGSGEMRWVSWTNRVLADAEGRVTALHSVGRDFTDRKRTEIEFRANQERLALATQAVGIGIWELHLTEGWLKWDDTMFTIFGVAREDFGGTILDWKDRVHPEDVVYSGQEFDAALSGQRPLDFDFRVVHANGDVRHLNARAVVFRDAQGQPIRVLGTNYDVTERRQMSQALAEQHELLRVTLQSIGDAVITTDGAGQVQWLNPVAERLTGWLNQAALGKPLVQVFHILHEETRLPVESPVERCLVKHETVGLAGHTLLVSRDGTEYGIEDSAAPIRDAQGKVLGAVLVFHDVSEQRRLSGEMSFRARHDPLTGLINRAEFESQLKRMLERSRADSSSNALMFIDLDQFKLVNDACGHAMGDQLLIQVSALMRGTVRASDTLARLGGDEFGVLLEHCSVERAQTVAQQICDRMEEYRFIHDGRRFSVGASIGLVPVDPRWASMDTVMQAADTACYAAKDAGRNRVHAWRDTDQMARLRKGEIQWASRLAQALDDNRFVLYGQRIAPITPLGALPAEAGLHCEVLLRLLDDDGSIIAPGAFLPAAERFHMASRIDRWVVRRVFEWLAAERGALGHVQTVSINLSGQSIGDRAFHRFVVELVAELAVDVRKLCFEVTETAAITHLNDAALFIEEMRHLGMRIALDDFGAGASSFGYLKTLPVDYLKIDGQFVRDLLDDPLDHAAVRCFQDVARVVGVQTVAEFVETDAILAELRTLGVDYAQGYLIHRPEPLHALVAGFGAQAGKKPSIDRYRSPVS